MSARVTRESSTSKPFKLKSLFLLPSLLRIFLISLEEILASPSSDWEDTGLGAPFPASDSEAISGDASSVNLEKKEIISI